MHSVKSLIVGAALLLSSGGVAVAAQTSSQNSSTKPPTSTELKVHEQTGTVSSLSNSELVLEHTVQGKKENTTFKLDSKTKKEGPLDKGAHVIVYYRAQNHERRATEVKAEPKKS